MRVIHGLQHGLAGFEGHSGLAIIADLQRSAPVDHARHFPAEGGIPSTGEEVEEGGLARSIPSDDAHPFIPLEIVSEIPQIALPVPPEIQPFTVDYFIS